MADHIHSRSCILAQNELKEVSLVDIPRSIELAIGAPERSKLISCSPIEKPFPSNEPKSDVARARLQKQVSPQAGEHARIISIALDVLKSSHSGPWCLPRVQQVQPHGARKRKRTELETKDEELDEAAPASEWDVLSDMSLAERGQSPLEYCTTTESKRMDQEQHDDWRGLAINDTGAIRSLHVWRTDNPESAHTFTLPARSACFMADCRSSADALRASVRNLAQEQDTPKTFDLIVLDPPWPNASVKRGHQRRRGHYSVSNSLWDVRDLLLGMDLDMLLGNKDGALVAVWVTNKPTVRELVLGQDGLFESLGVELVEEWLWIKVTSQGQPVLPLDGLWRKPYEVLLVGRKQSSGRREDEVSRAQAIKRRVIAAVPDTHSRKPCLKELLESAFELSVGYRALEVFSRHLVTGWWSWGNEALKYNDECFWSTAEGDDEDHGHDR